MEFWDLTQYPNLHLVSCHETNLRIYPFFLMCSCLLENTAVQLVFNPFSQLVPQLELYSQLQLSLWSDPIAFSVPKPT